MFVVFIMAQLVFKSNVFVYIMVIDGYSVRKRLFDVGFCPSTMCCVFMATDVGQMCVLADPSGHRDSVKKVYSMTLKSRSVCYGTSNSDAE